jgi:hypothetical protein
VGAGVGFAGGAEVCSLSAVPALETKARIITKTIRIIGWIKKRGAKGAAAQNSHASVTLIYGLNK